MPRLRLGSNRDRQLSGMALRRLRALRAAEFVKPFRAENELELQLARDCAG